MFWIENEPLIFSGVKGDFRNALINGSAFQRELDAFDRLINPLRLHAAILRKNLEKGDAAARKALRVVEEELKTKAAGFVVSNTSSPAAAYILSVYCVKWGRAFSFD
ncbi:hypothetical protein [Lacibacter cauensis]|uniref:hypothetical protein n=1 Tax=Lacibacter cauensis TaxID=510947 RepID=UPI00119E28D6|nr:hypothetical protein [Lacibacter cauensis]